MSARAVTLAISLAILLIVAVAAPILPLHDPTAIDMAGAFHPGSPAHLLGQDQYGRDVLSRLVWGARASLSVAASATAIAAIIGGCLGLVGAYFRGIAETLTIRPTDVLLCFPPLLLALLVITLTGPGIGTLVVVLALVFVPNFTRVTFGAALSVRQRDFVTAMQVAGARAPYIMVRTILPNVAGPLLVQISIAIAAAIILEAGLSFLGLGVVPPAPSWGLMIADARATMLQHPLLMIWPCLALAGTIFLCNLCCDLLRDRIDPAPVSHSIFGHPGALEASAGNDSLLEIKNLTIRHGDSVLVDGADLKVRQGEFHALIGASGSGKSLTSLAIMGLLDEPLVPSGQIWLAGHSILEMGEAGLRKLRGSTVSMIFQDPASGLNPTQTVGAQIADAILAHRRIAGAELEEEVISLMRRVDLPEPETRRHHFPHQLSGGQRQRVMIAMAIANSPMLLLADEPTTALDVTVQAEVMLTLLRLRAETGMGILFVTHNLALVANHADFVSVMQKGRIIESGSAETVLDRPRHGYTRALIHNAPENLTRRRHASELAHD